ncbi:MAG: TIGR00269 family protein [Candidatus Bathyarchaeota archaeon]|nr:MAG: TIGR00269 family protein [Candidatus Bathyarchaeota archaeon]
MRATIAKHDMLKFNDKIAIGVSGGKDSMTLLSILAKLEKSFPKARLMAITVDEGISGYRDEALNIAEKFCQKLAVEHIVVSFKDLFGFEFDELAKDLIMKDPSIERLTPCAYCGVLRRRALNTAARNCEAAKLATGHNLDDETQTILLNVFHGDPQRIARVKPVSSAAHPKFIRRIKPLCEVLEKEATLYAYLKQIEFQSIPCPYSYAALRNDIRTMLNRMEEKHAGLKYTVYRSAEKLRNHIGEALPATGLNSCKLCGEPTVHAICQPCKLLENFKLYRG